MAAVAPILVVNESTLTFAKNAQIDRRFRFITIKQVFAQTPVTLTTDAPERFLLAVGRDTTFAPSVTLTPSAEGSDVRVQFVPDRAGVHKAQLTIRAPYGHESVALVGQYDAPPRSLSRRFPALTLFMLAGLVALGWAFRCRLAPELCRADARSSAPDNVKPAPAAQPRPTTPDRLPEVKPFDRPEQPPTNVVASPRPAAPAGEATDSIANVVEAPAAGRPGNVVKTPARDTMGRATTSGRAPKSLSSSEVPKPASATRPRNNPRRPPAARPSSLTEESDLERILNRKTDRQ